MVADEQAGHRREVIVASRLSVEEEDGWALPGVDDEDALVGDAADGQLTLSGSWRGPRTWP